MLRVGVVVRGELNGYNLAHTTQPLHFLHIYQTLKMRRSVGRPHSTPATLVWLNCNFESQTEGCISRSTLYAHYLDFCASQTMGSVNAASFGKIVRQRFPGLQTRRLGTRGQSKYHYYGLSIRAESPLCAKYLQSSMSACYSLTESDQLQEIEYQTEGICAPIVEFPSSNLLANLRQDFPREQMEEFLRIYTAHSTQVLHSGVNLNFIEVERSIYEFWTNFPPNLFNLLSMEMVMSLIGIFDVITYKSVSHGIFPLLLINEVSPNRAENAGKIGEKIMNVLAEVLEYFPHNIRTMKIHLARKLESWLKRRESLNRLCIPLRILLRSESGIRQMLYDWRHIDINIISHDAEFQIGKLLNKPTADVIYNYSKEFEGLLKNQVDLSFLGSWVRGIVERCNANGNPGRNFLLVWPTIGSRILRELTLANALSFGSFHLLYLMIADCAADFIEVVESDQKIHNFLGVLYNPQFPNGWSLE